MKEGTVPIPLTAPAQCDSAVLLLKVKLHLRGAQSGRGESAVSAHFSRAKTKKSKNEYQIKRSNRSFLTLQMGQIPGGCSRAQR